MRRRRRLSGGIVELAAVAGLRRREILRLVWDQDLTHTLEVVA
jgi:hypothetical protein